VSQKDADGAINIMTTGATGVAGRRVVAALVEKGHHVLALARSRANENVLAGTWPRRIADLIRLIRHRCRCRAGLK
jgi:nucleoside-diphosphate-sugar epimerase